ncbi:hypothetical protein CPC16_009003 [Podila verticillata]|nr:hypothetical protein BGZ59_008452 [Podila verticillata]KAF9383244.1 hypothetical protein CPC16_009003 [Podila verticillata]
MDQVDVSQALMDARRSLIKKKSELKDASDLLSRNPLPTPTGFEEAYNPDYFGEYDGFPVVIVEIKKPGAMDDDIEGDQRRLPCMQKLMLDRMLSARIKDPKVVGFLIRRSRCEITIMSLDHEALYVVKTVRVFELPQNNFQLGLLCPALGPLKFVRKEAISRTLNAVKTRSSKHIMRGSWRRPSYYVKGNRIPPPRSSIEGVEDLLISKTQQKNQEQE